MKCPIPIVYRSGPSGIVESELRDCLEGGCAWWDEGSNACAIWSLMSGLDALGKVVREIVDKMPYKKTN